MNHLHIPTYTLICSLSFSKQSIHTSGGDIMSSAQGSISFSIGQITTNHIANGEVINEGVQQPLEIFHVVSINNPDEQVKWGVFPNPTKGIIHLKSKEAMDFGIDCYKKRSGVRMTNTASF